MRAALAARTPPEMLRLTQALHGLTQALHGLTQAPHGLTQAYTRLTQALHGLTHAQARRQAVFFKNFPRSDFGIRDTKLIFLLKMKTL